MKKIVVLTGAGMSAESGISTFRDSGGLWEQHRVEDVATIEGYPTLQTAIGQMRAMKGRKVTLVPLLFVAGDHATNDIAVGWKQRLQEEGFSVSLAIEGLGQIPEIQDLYINKVK